MTSTCQLICSVLLLLLQCTLQGGKMTQHLAALKEGDTIEVTAPGGVLPGLTAGLATTQHGVHGAAPRSMPHAQLCQSHLRHALLTIVSRLAHTCVTPHHSQVKGPMGKFAYEGDGHYTLNR